MLSLPVKRRHSSAPPGVDSRKCAFVKQSSSPSSDDDAPLVALPSQLPPAASAAATFPAAAADHATAAECCDCDESETSGFGHGDEAEDLDIDDGVSMQDVQATAMVRPLPYSIFNAGFVDSVIILQALQDAFHRCCQQLPKRQLMTVNPF